MWPVAVPSSVSSAAHSGAAAASRFKIIAHGTMPLEQKEAALALARQARADLLKAMKALSKECREAKAARDDAAREAARYARNEERIAAASAARLTGERMAASLPRAAEMVGA